MNPIATFKSDYQARKIAKTFIGWSWKIMKHEGEYVICCNGNKFYYADGSIN